MNISILTPDRQVFIGSIESVTVPGTSGLFQVKQNHAPLVSSLDSGSVKLRTNGEYALYSADKGELEEGLNDSREISFAIEGGFIEVLRNEISLLVQGVGDLN
ncbi:MAG: hypothetical protein AAFY36_04770 [Bacteroidota bacterium]